MVYRISIKLVAVLIAILIIVVLGVYYVFQSGVFADDIGIGGKPDIEINHTDDLDGDKTDEKIGLLTYKLEDSNRYILEVSKGLFSKKRVELSQFEWEISFCNQGVIDADSLGKFICITGYVGIHSQRVEVYKYSSSSITKIKFVTEGYETDNVIGDAPNAFVDNQGSKKVKVCVDNRNYEKDPLLDFSRSCYILNDEDEFVLDSKIEARNEPDVSSQGAIE